MILFIRLFTWLIAVAFALTDESSRFTELDSEFTPFCMVLTVVVILFNLVFALDMSPCTPDIVPLSVDICDALLLTIGCR